MTPDLVKGSMPDLRAAVTEAGWPELDAVRGRAMFVLTGDGDLRKAYTRGDANLDGRLAFAASGRNVPYASVLVMDDPRGRPPPSGRGERRLHRADARRRGHGGATPARFLRLEAALASGARLVSTDVPVKVRDYGDYVVAIPGGPPGRCNPVAAPAGCTSASIESR